MTVRYVMVSAMALLCACASAPELPRLTSTRAVTPEAAFRRTAPAELPVPEQGTALEPVVHALANGMRLYVVQTPGRPLVSVRYVARSAAHQAGRDGSLAPVVARALLLESEGADGQAEVGHQVLGESVFSHVDRSGTVVGIDALAFVAADAVQLVAKVVRAPTLSTWALAQARLDHDDDVLRASHTFEGLAAPLVLELLYGSAHPWAAGTRAQQRALREQTDAEARDFYQRHYRPEQSALVVTGDVDPEAMRQVFEAAFSGWPAGTGEAPRARVMPVAPAKRVHALYAKGPQSLVIIALPAVSARSLRFPAMRMVSDLLGRFGSATNVGLRRHAGASYGNQVRLHAQREAGYLTVSLRVDNGSVRDAVRLVEAEVKRFAQQGPTGAQLRSARRAFVRWLKPRSVTAQADLLAWMLRNDVPLSFLSEAERAAELVDAEEVRGLFREVVDVEHSPVVVIGDFTRTHSQLESLGDVQLYEAAGDQ